MNDLAVESAILAIVELNSQSNYTRPFCALEENVLIGWNCLGLSPGQYVCVPTNRVRTAYEHQSLLSAHTEQI